MSLIKLRNTQEETAEHLQQRLTEEFAHPAADYAQPFIHVQLQQPGDRVHLLVIWDDWDALSQAERSILIMDAYAAAEGGEAASRVSVAMGLTQEEAKRLGFDFEPA